jgi:hypothetical protein
MRGSAFIAFFGIAIAISGSLVGCGDDESSDDDDDAPAKVTKSGSGESCVTTNDCAEGLACYGNVCQDAPNGTGGTDGTGGSSTGGGGTAPTTLGGEGESCTRRADCRSPLGCYNQRCASAGSGEGGGGNVPTRGQRGETCLVSSDCEEELICLPGAALSGVGICTIGDADTTPSGMACLNHECRDAEDCCELPINLHASLGVTSCAELADTLGTAACNSSTPTALQPLCMAQAAYCDCAADAWECQNGFCAYTAECSASGMVPNGCPTSSRTGRALFATCDLGETDLCQPAVVDPPCVMDDDCDGLAVADDLADTCGGGECTCYESMCLRRCDEDLDCAVGFVCDTGDDICVPADACTSDERCQATLRDVRAVCADAVCSIPCVTDIDCNATLTGAFTQVCDTDGMCKPLGCTEDDQCPAAANGARTFCTEPPAGGAPIGSSAITD